MPVTIEQLRHVAHKEHIARARYITALEVQLVKHESAVDAVESVELIAPRQIMALAQSRLCEYARAIAADGGLAKAKEQGT